MELFKEFLDTLEREDYFLIGFILLGIPLSFVEDGLTKLFMGLFWFISILFITYQTYNFNSHYWRSFGK